MDAVSGLAADVLAAADDPWDGLVRSELLEVEDLLDVCALLVQVGRHGARAPALATLVLGAPAGASGGAIATGGLQEPGRPDPMLAATRCHEGRLVGTKICVMAAERAERIVVPAQDGLYVARLADCQVELQTGTDDDALGVVTLDGATAERVGDREALAGWLAKVEVGICAVLLGLSQKALELTASYVKERHQFGRPVGMFQAVQQRVADAWIATEVMEVTFWQAAWRVSEGLPSDRERAIARYWASEGSHQVCAAAQHLHGGFGFDRDYELHRFFLCAKQHEFLLGGANAQLDRLGALLAR